MRFQAVSAPIDERRGESRLPLLSVSQYTGVRLRSDLTNEDARAEDLSTYKVVRPGDIVVNRMSAYQGALGLSDYWGICSPDYLVLRLAERQHGRFWHYYMRSHHFVSEMTSRVRGIGSAGNGGVRTPRISYQEMKTILVPELPMFEQSQVAVYLDRETATIDTLIEKQQQLLDQLRERRAAFIREELAQAGPGTPLRRLTDPSRPMTYGILQAGPHVHDGVPYIGPSDISNADGPVRLVDLRRTAPEIAEQYTRSRLREGDLVVSIGPAFGHVTQVLAELEGANLTQDTVRVALASEAADTRFVSWVLSGPAARAHWEFEITGATFRRLNLGTLARTPIPLPPLDEQRRIADHLDQETAKIDTLIAKAERFIELAQERRAALITGAVTGQISIP